MNRAVLLTAAVLVAGCRGQTSEESPLWPLRNMFHQQRYNPQSESNYFQDHRSQRPMIEGTVPRTATLDAHNLSLDDRVTTGREAGNAGYVMTLPDEVVANATGMPTLLARGRDRFGIYCTPCHGALGDGQGMVPVRALTQGYSFPAPPTFHQDRIRHEPDGQVFATISYGVRNMPAYAAQIPVQDRWAIVAYVRALQLSQTGAPQ